MDMMSATIGALAAALAKAQGAIEGATKGKVNPHFKSRYADLSSVVEACKAALSANGLAVVQSVSSEGDNKVTITTMLLHTSGEWMRSALTLAAGKSDPQGIGSAITYGRRYGLAAMVGVAPVEDDDANEASSDAPIAPMPAGYQEWLTNLEAAADEGLSALEAAYKANAPAGCKAYLVAHGGGTEALKARARKAGGA